MLHTVSGAQVSAEAGRQLTIASGYPVGGVVERAVFIVINRRMQRQGRLGAWLFSLLLWVLAGYGYRLGRIAATYVLVVGVFAAAYYLLGAPAGETPLIWTGTLQLSLTNIHGRVFTGMFMLDTPQAWLAAIQAVLGIVIEGTFVAMLSQRFVGR